jgi:hypothetical protein
LPFIPKAFGFRRDGSLLVGDALQPLADLADVTVF